jgi:hypothetical protein
MRTSILCVSVVCACFPCPEDFEFDAIEHIIHRSALTLTLDYFDPTCDSARQTVK